MLTKVFSCDFFILLPLIFQSVILVQVLCVVWDKDQGLFADDFQMTLWVFECCISLPGLL